MFYIDKSKTPCFIQCNGYHTLRTKTDLYTLFGADKPDCSSLISTQIATSHIMSLQNHFVQDLCTNFNTDELLISIWIRLFKFSTSIIITDLIDVYFPFKLFRFHLMGNLLADEHWSHDNQNDDICHWYIVHVTRKKSRATELLFGRRNHSRYYPTPENSEEWME